MNKITPFFYKALYLVWSFFLLSGITYCMFCVDTITQIILFFTLIFTTLTAVVIRKDFFNAIDLINGKQPFAMNSENKIEVNFKNKMDFRHAMEAPSIFAYMHSVPTILGAAMGIITAIFSYVYTGVLDPVHLTLLQFGTASGAAWIAASGIQRHLGRKLQSVKTQYSELIECDELHFY